MVDSSDGRESHRHGVDYLNRLIGAERGGVNPMNLGAFRVRLKDQTPFSESFPLAAGVERLIRQSNTFCKAGLEDPEPLGCPKFSSFTIIIEEGRPEPLGEPFVVNEDHRRQRASPFLRLTSIVVFKSGGDIAGGW